MKRRDRFRQTTLLIVGCASLLAGVGISHTGLVVTWLICVLSGIFCLISFRRKDWLSLIFIILFGLFVGLYRGHSFMIDLKPYNELNAKKVVLDVVADSDGGYDEHKQLSFDAKSIQVLQPQTTKLVGKIKVSGFGTNIVLRGNKLRVQGKLFVTRGSKQASVNYAELTVLDKSTSPFDNFRRKFAAGLATMLPEPLGPFGLGLLVGQKTSLPEEVTTWLSLVGLTHIIAVSGYNLTIIVRFMHRIFGRYSRYQTLVASTLVVGSFLLITGFSASIVRAAIVCGLSLICWYYGRTIRPLLLLLFTAAITALWYPIYVWSDIGWYLSFLAFFGVMILAPLIVSRLFKKSPKPITLVVVESFCAQLMTMPIILFIFHQTSIIAVVTNILIVPLVPLAMLLSLISGLTGMILPSAGLVAWPSRLILTYILDIAHFFARLPGIVLTVNISKYVMAASYLIVGFICLVLWHKRQQDYATITDENDLKMELL